MKSELALNYKENVSVRLSSVPEWKIVDAVKRGVIVKVNNDSGGELILAANAEGNLCYMDGKNKKLLTDMRGWTMDEVLWREVDGNEAKEDGGELNSGLSGGKLEKGSTETLKAILAVLSGETAAKPDPYADMDIDDPFDYSLFEVELDTAFLGYPKGDLLRVSYMIGLMRRYGIILQAVYQMDSYKLLFTCSFGEDRMAEIFAEATRKHKLNFRAAQVGRRVHFLFYDLTVQQVMNLEKLKNLKINIDWGKGGNVKNYHGGAHIPSGNATANPGRGSGNPGRSSTP